MKWGLGVYYSQTPFIYSEVYVETVEIIFHNIQSHEHTEFCLKPGMNFILADDNNVGKSTIFKVLTRIAKAPTIDVPEAAAAVITS